MAKNIERSSLGVEYSPCMLSNLNRMLNYHILSPFILIIIVSLNTKHIIQYIYQNLFYFQEFLKTCKTNKLFSTFFLN